MAYIRGQSPDQGSLFPISLDELIPEEHLMCVIAAYCGAPGHFQRIRSSRRLEAKCQRNVEAMWLLGRLAPGFKTIADSRKDNGLALKATCRAFVQFCRQVGPIAGERMAIHSRFQATTSTCRQLSLKRQQAAMDKSITQ